MIRYIILQKLVRNDNIFSDQLIEPLYIEWREFSIMCDYLQTKIGSRDTSLALTDFAAIIRYQIFMKFPEHLLHLFIQRFQFLWLTKFVKKNGVSLNFRNFKTDLVGPDQYLQ